MRRFSIKLAVFLLACAVGYWLDTLDSAVAQPAPLGTVRFEFVAEAEKGVRVYRSVGLERQCFLAVTEWDGLAAGKSSSLTCP